MPWKPTEAGHRVISPSAHFCGPLCTMSLVQPLSFPKPVSSSVNPSNDAACTGLLGGLRAKVHVEHVVLWPAHGQAALHRTPSVCICEGAHPFPQSNDCFGHHDFQAPCSPQKEKYHYFSGSVPSPGTGQAWEVSPSPNRPHGQFA